MVDPGSVLPQVDFFLLQLPVRVTYVHVWCSRSFIFPVVEYSSVWLYRSHLSIMLLLGIEDVFRCCYRIYSLLLRWSVDWLIFLLIVGVIFLLPCTSGNFGWIPDVWISPGWMLVLSSCTCLWGDLGHGSLETAGPFSLAFVCYGGPGQSWVRTPFAPPVTQTSSSIVPSGPWILRFPSLTVGTGIILRPVWAPGTVPASPSEGFCPWPRVASLLTEGPGAHSADFWSSLPVQLSSLGLCPPDSWHLGAWTPSPVFLPRRACGLCLGLRALQHGLETHGVWQMEGSPPVFPLSCGHWLSWPLFSVMNAVGSWRLSSFLMVPGRRVNPVRVPAPWLGAGVLIVVLTSFF